MLDEEICKLSDTIIFGHESLLVAPLGSPGLMGNMMEYPWLHIAPCKNPLKRWFNEFIVASARIVEPVEESCQASWMLQLGMSL